VSWKIAEAKRRFSEVLRRAEQQPQVIQNRERVVAVVMSPSDAARALRGAAPSMRDALADLRRIAAQTDYELELPARLTRDVSLDWPTDVPRRHKRSQRAR
jgi:prevent-host-death family protein